MNWSSYIICACVLAWLAIKIWEAAELTLVPQAEPEKPRRRVAHMYREPIGPIQPHAFLFGQYLECDVCGRDETDPVHIV